MCDRCITIKTQERRHWRRSGIFFFFNFEYIQHLVLKFLFLTLNCRLGRSLFCNYHAKWSFTNCKGKLYQKQMSFTACKFKNTYLPMYLSPTYCDNLFWIHRTHMIVFWYQNIILRHRNYETVRYFSNYLVLYFKARGWFFGLLKESQ